MKLRIIHKIYIGIAVLLTTAILIKCYRYESWNRFYYDGTAFAPATYPVYIRELYFITAYDNHVNFDTENVNYFKGEGWGDDNFFAEATEDNLVPDKLVIKYASYRDSSFYNDTILLPKEKISAAFEEILKNDKGTEIYHKGLDKKGIVFVAGIANNGHIVLWAKGNNYRKEITRTKLTAKIPGAADTYFGKDMTKEAYLEDRFGSLNDSIKALIKSGYDANANYVDSALALIYCNGG